MSRSQPRPRGSQAHPGPRFGFRPRSASGALVLGLALATALGAGCRGNGGAGDDPQPATKRPKKSKLTRFTFEDKESNQQTGARLPEEDAELIGPDGQPVSLSTYRGKPVVLVFMRGFPGFICPYCTTYTAQIATRYEEIAAAGAEVIIVYPTELADVAKVEQFVAACDEILEEEGAEGLPFPVFLDPGLKAVRRYNIQGDLSRPSTFVLDAQGVIQYVYVGAKSDDRPAVDRILQEVQGLKGA